MVQEGLFHASSSDSLFMIAFLVAFDNVYGEASPTLSILTLWAIDDTAERCRALASTCGAGVVVIVDWNTYLEVSMFLLETGVTLVFCIILTVVTTCDL